MQRKIRLDVDRLHVQSYPTTVAESVAGGTVHAREDVTTSPCSGYATCLSACSATDGVHICKTCGPCC
ncbi:MAG: hypothetical protein JO306_09545 [Gemmatimonadetes bacterium]|nr:hypothetical protein [Gemmatimonadota bacterium]